MKKIILILSCICSSFFLMAQEKTTNKEIGIAFSNLDEFGITFRIGSEKSLWRFNTILVSEVEYNYSLDEYKSTDGDFNCGLKIGREYRKSVTENLELRYGTDISFRFSNSNYEYDSETDDSNDYNRETKYYIPGVNIVLGFNYILKNNFILGAEILPSINYYKRIDKYDYPNNNVENIKNKTSYFKYNLSNSSAVLSLVYRF